MFTPGPQPLAPVARPEETYDTGPEYLDEPRQFAGIDIDEFHFARQRSRRAVVLWVLAVLVLTGLVAAAAWSVGLNYQGLLPSSP